MSFMRGMSFVSPILVIAFLSGCATTASMKYEPLNKQQPLKNISIRVDDFKDNRPESEKGNLGRVFNQYGGSLAPVKESPTMLHDFKKALESELATAGYSLTSETKDLLLSPTLEFVACDQVDTTGKAKMRLRFTLLDHSQAVLNQTYASEAEHWVLVGFSSAEAITKATQQIISQFIKDLDQYIAT